LKPYKANVDFPLVEAHATFAKVCACDVCGDFVDVVKTYERDVYKM
jgi:hypothetical protein